eukprot:3585416-Amphidinium_carterae.1
MGNEKWQMVLEMGSFAAEHDVTLIETKRWRVILGVAMAAYCASKGSGENGAARRVALRHACMGLEEGLCCVMWIRKAG